VKEALRRGRFPFGNVVVLQGRAQRVLVDTGAGDGILDAVMAGGPFDVVINSHYHIDHVRGNGRDVDDYLASLRRLDALVDEASGGGRHRITILTSHRRPLSYESFKERLPGFTARFGEREERAGPSTGPWRPSYRASGNPNTLCYDTIWTAWPRRGESWPKASSSEVRTCGERSEPSSR